MTTPYITGKPENEVFFTTGIADDQIVLTVHDEANGCTNTIKMNVDSAEIIANDFLHYVDTLRKKYE